MAARGTSDAVREALVRVGAGAGDLESVARPLLDALQVLTGLESTYLTSIDWDDQLQRIVLSRNTGELAIEAGLEVPWEDTLCRRAMESGTSATDDVPTLWGDSGAARDLGIQTYVSVPVILADGQVYGTLCGASSEPVPVDEPTRALLAVFSRIIADTVARERQLAVASARAVETDRLLRARSQFVAAAQHRLKTPLTVIRGWTTLLLDGDHEMDEEERRSALQSIARAAVNAIADVGSMLTESESDALARDLSIGPVDVVQLATGCCSDLAALSERHDLVVDADPQVPPAYTDPEAVRVILEHLMENAVKYSPDGGRVVVRLGVSDAGRVRIDVCDEGVGLPAGVDVFAPFTRGPDRTTEGSGLGLHIVQSLVHAVGGEVTARRNQPAPGSTMTVLLPAAGLRLL
jgi:signal transduction histidine kinase